ncbi:MAG: hypothetical protein ACREQ9_05020 [Candidatus Binatia bacterium]
MIHAIYDPVLGDVTRVPQGFDNAPGPTGSAYQDGFYGQVRTDLAQVLGQTVASPTSRTYCGGGDVVTCAGRLWSSLAAAGDALAADQGDDPAAWNANPELERIRFLPAAAVSMHWVNRPTFQQLMQFGGE